MTTEGEDAPEGGYEVEVEVVARMTVRLSPGTALDHAMNLAASAALSAVRRLPEADGSLIKDVRVKKDAVVFRVTQAWPTGKVVKLRSSVGGGE